MKHTLVIILALVSASASAQFVNNNGIRINNSADVSTNGDWSNDAGTVFVNTATVRTSGGFVNNGTLNASGLGGFILDYASDLNFRPGGTLPFLVKNGTGSALAQSTIRVQDSLVLNNGALRVLNASDTVSLAAGGLLVASPGAYVEGMMARSGVGDILFPVGKDGNDLALTLHQMNAKKVTAIAIDAPPGYLPGPGLDSLINFPYAWRVFEQIPSDTAGYVEVDYADNLPVGANPIIARGITGQKYASMGARFISQADGRVIVRSYSRRLNGLYTIANGFPVDLETDSLALIALFEATNGPEWTDTKNWGAGRLDTWEGVDLNGQSITAVELPSNNLVGIVPDVLVDIQALQTVNLSGNHITRIPDFTSNTEITSLNVSNNKLDFGSLEPNATVPGFEYANQAVLGEPIDSLIEVGSSYSINLDAGGASSEYVWRRNGQVIEGATGPVYTIDAINRANMGEYGVTVTNPVVPGLTLTSAPHVALAYANVSGSLFVDQDTPASKGKVTLLKIKTGAYDSLAPIDINTDGTFTIGKVVLADYQLLGFADTLTHEDALPTYYSSTIYWEEADTIVLEQNIDQLNIVSQLKPQPTSGEGSISGTFEEDDGTGGRGEEIEKVQRIKKAAVSVRRVESSGRGKEEILTLVAYTFTNEQGEFTLANLPAGTYRLNLQYPGYPMDETSFITITLDNALQSQVSVAAAVVNGKVNVKKLIVTGVAGEDYQVQLYPNPAVDQVRMKFGSMEPSRVVALLDLTGKVIRATAAAAAELQLEVGDLPPGMFVIHVREKERVVKVLKLSIE